LTSLQVFGKLIADKAKPAVEGADLKPEQWGCWRSHVNLWRKIVTENIDTALIIEDDLDWDVNIKDIFHRLGGHMRKLNAIGIRSTPWTEWEEKNAPYGQDWDTLHLGTCFDFPPATLPVHLTYDDPHSPGRDQLNGVYLAQLETVWKERLPITNKSAFRVLSPAWNPVCTIGYAVTQRGAQRLLYNIGIQPIADPVDVAMLMALKKGSIRGYSVVPPVLTTWKTGNARDSDIDNVHDMKDKGLFMTGSKNLRHSARVAMAEMQVIPLWHFV
jgi:GR25 family glycosyltransferase involved in LPS biosynthesis